MTTEEHEQRLARLEATMTMLTDLGIKSAERISGIEAALATLTQLETKSVARISEIEDALTIMAHLETKSSNQMREQAEWLKQHEIAMTEFDGKLNALIDIIGRQQAGMEARN